MTQSNEHQGVLLEVREALDSMFEAVLHASKNANEEEDIEIYIPALAKAEAIIRLDAFIAAVPENLNGEVSVIAPALKNDNIIFRASHEAAQLLSNATTEKPHG